ncbi:MAG: LysM peptidoglycan-binding domain-containing protein [Egibacteraceae bacterium]
MTYSSYEELVRRAVRDHQRIGRAGGGRWVVTMQAPPPCFAKVRGPLRETLRTGYGSWVRTTAITGLASALLVPPGAAASPVAPGLPATNPQAIGPSRLEARGADPRPQKLLGGLAQSATRGNSPQAVAQPDRQAGKPVAPLQSPPSARQPLAAQIPSLAAAKLAAPQPENLCRNITGRCRGSADEGSPARLTAPNPRSTGVPPGPAAMGGLPPTPSAHRVGTEQSQPTGQRPGGTVAALEERAKVPESRPVTPERVDQWATTVRTAMRTSATPRGLEDAAGRPALFTLGEVSPTPRVGWSYRVKRGDSLWRISAQLWEDDSSGHSLDRASRVLHEWNRDVVGTNSNLIYPGQVLEIPAAAEDVTTTWSAASPHPVAEDVAR